jgi:hypothetical protein
MHKMYVYYIYKIHFVNVGVCERPAAEQRFVAELRAKIESFLMPALAAADAQAVGRQQQRLCHALRDLWYTFTAISSDHRYTMHRP